MEQCTVRPALWSVVCKGMNASLDSSPLPNKNRAENSQQRMAICPLDKEYYFNPQIPPENRSVFLPFQEDQGILWPYGRVRMPRGGCVCVYSGVIKVSKNCHLVLRCASAHHHHGIRINHNTKCGTTERVCYLKHTVKRPRPPAAHNGFQQLVRERRAVSTKQR